MSSYTTTSTVTDTFTATHAKYIASKVATDLLRFRRFYGAPSDEWINRYEMEMTVLLKYDAVDEVVYGFKRIGLWTMASVRYIALPGGSIRVDDDPGKIRPGVDISGASFTSFLTYSSRWSALSSTQRANIERELPFRRITQDAPDLEAGVWTPDLNYIAGGRGFGRSTVRT